MLCHAQHNEQQTDKIKSAVAPHNPLVIEDNESVHSQDIIGDHE